LHKLFEYLAFMDYINIAVKVLKERQARGWDELALSRLAGVDRDTVVHIEEGRLPSVRTLLKIARALDKPPSWFLS
jgi:transcriptional regulator with XRE-family HTH domain